MGRGAQAAAVSVVKDVTVTALFAMCAVGNKITMLTCYEASFTP